MSLVQRLANAVVSKLIQRRGLEKLEEDTPFLDFLMELFDKLLPLLIQCFGVMGAAEQAKRPSLIARVRLRLAIRRELGDAESIDLLAGPLFDAILEAGTTITSDEIKTFAESKASAEVAV